MLAGRAWGAPPGLSRGARGPQVAKDPGPGRVPPLLPTPADTHDTDGHTMSLPRPAMALPADPAAPPLAGPEGLDLVFIEGFVGHTVIGIHTSELHQPQPLVIDVCAGLPPLRACHSDAIGDTLDYGVLRERLQRLMAEHRVTLLEALAEQIATLALTEFGAHWVRVRVAKPRKFPDVSAVGGAGTVALRTPRVSGTPKAGERGSLPLPPLQRAAAPEPGAAAVPHAARSATRC
ncbi:dihydroneopterin aldolase [Piscinibacter sakaiensis]|uniref:dihydroneopterin aldolase n=1 Tax=Piscinibacter sakaiensis TaxID=1547922 RepID=UPI00372CA0C5